MINGNLCLLHSDSCHLITIGFPLLVITCYLELLVTCLGEGQENQVLYSTVLHYHTFT